MTQEQLQTLKNELQNRLTSLQTALHLQNETLEELKGGVLKDEADIISADMQANLDINLVKRHILEIKQIVISLKKIDTGLYGICEMCDSDISIERLQAKPHARYCIICRGIYEKGK